MKISEEVLGSKEMKRRVGMFALKINIQNTVFYFFLNLDRNLNTYQWHQMKIIISAVRQMIYLVKC